MRVPSFKTVAQHLGGFLLAAFFVGLLSFTFSFLGTIFCAALAGIALGALRGYKLQSVLVSLLFPLAILTLMRGMKADLEERQIRFVALACLGVFWLSYGAAATLFFFERKAPSPTGPPVPAQACSLGPPAGESVSPAVAAQRPGAAHGDGRLSLEMLQGNWSGDARAHPTRQRVSMKIAGERLTLLAVDDQGRMRVLGEARLKLVASDSHHTLELSEAGVSPGFNTAVKDAPATPSDAGRGAGSLPPTPDPSSDSSSGDAATRPAKPDPARWRS